MLGVGGEKVGGEEELGGVEGSASLRRRLLSRAPMGPSSGRRSSVPSSGAPRSDPPRDFLAARGSPDPFQPSSGLGISRPDAPAYPSVPLAHGAPRSSSAPSCSARVTHFLSALYLTLFSAKVIRFLERSDAVPKKWVPIPLERPLCGRQPGRPRPASLLPAHWEEQLHKSERPRFTGGAHGASSRRRASAGEALGPLPLARTSS